MKSPILTTQAPVRFLAQSPLYGSARTLIRKQLNDLSVGNIVLRDELDTEAVALDENAIIIDVHDMRFYIDVLIAGSNGAASAYRDGYWSCNKLTGLFQLMVRNLSTLDSMERGFASIGNWWLKRRHKARNNTRKGSRENIHAHYDLGNEFFELMLDPTMTYSSGFFQNADSSMEEASIEKLDRICRKLDLKANDHVIEIGTGWGSFAIHAASYYGCRVTTTTISREQFKLANQRIRKHGLQDKIDIQLSDYRDLTGQYDKLVSIEMIEAVGNQFLPGYFSKCSQLLKENGQACIQAITMPDQRYSQYLETSDFIQQFIFPGSCVPSLCAMQNAITEGSDMRITSLEDFGLHYARTLDEWHRQFRSNLNAVRELGYGEDFTRLWEYYLCYCEAGFRERYTGLVQVVLDKPAHSREALKR
ncbi:MAG: methyltransferase domain-containing protein [Gammaproteobacteria bacterium]|nr:methyltransferase domain-containing protein [Gammaproteobacteria bacterium]